jgi:hypothetical protein
MKYISKEIQKYLLPEQKKEYRKILKQRLDFIKEFKPKTPVRLYSQWSKKSWLGVPTRRQTWYIKDDNEKKAWRDFYNKRAEFCEKVKKLESLAFERKEQHICVKGYALVRKSYYSRYKNVIFVVQEKESRDYYNLLQIGGTGSMRIIREKWSDIVRCYELKYES